MSKVAIVTDGRMSGASGKVPSAIHMSPEALDGGVLAKIETGDMIRLDAEKGALMLLVEEEELAARVAASVDLNGNRHGFGRELFAAIRHSVGSAEAGAAVFDLTGEERA